MAGYFSPTTGWVYLYDEDGPDREFEINKNVHEGTHQLEHWFTRQKNEWGPARVPQSFFGEGFAEYMGSVTMAKDRTLKFVGINRPRLQCLKQIKQQRGKANQKMSVFPLKSWWSSRATATCARGARRTGASTRSSSSTSSRGRSCTS